MKDFIQKTIAFSIFTLLAITTLVVGTNVIIASKATFKFNSSKTSLILGHSHSAYALNDSLINNTINLSASGESYFYNYQKFKKVVEDNQQINTLFVEFANNQIDSTMDSWIWGFDKMSAKIKYYTPFLEYEDFKLLFKNNPSELSASYSIATRKHLYRILGRDFNFVNDIGGYSYSNLSKIDSMIAINDYNYSISKNLTISETNIEYLRKIIDHANNNDIKVFLIRSPQHPLYADLVNELIYKNVLKTKFNDVELLDFDSLNFPNNNYLDFHHLNYLGAQKFSKLFNSLIELGLLNSSEKQKLIDDAINNFNNNNP